MKKIYVIDTNVLVHDPEALLRFEDNEIVLPIAVIEELDGLKRGQGEIPASVRQALRLIDSFREQGNLSRGVPLPGGGSLRVETAGDAAARERLSADNSIIMTAVALGAHSRAAGRPRLQGPGGPDQGRGARGRRPELPQRQEHDLSALRAPARGRGGVRRALGRLPARRRSTRAPARRARAGAGAPPPVAARDQREEPRAGVRHRRPRDHRHRRRRADGEGRHRQDAAGARRRDRADARIPRPAGAQRQDRATNR